MKKDNLSPLENNDDAISEAFADSVVSPPFKGSEPGKTPTPTEDVSVDDIAEAIRKKIEEDDSIFTDNAHPNKSHSEKSINNYLNDDYDDGDESKSPSRLKVFLVTAVIATALGVAVAMGFSLLLGNDDEPPTVPDNSIVQEEDIDVVDPTPTPAPEEDDSEAEEDNSVDDDNSASTDKPRDPPIDFVTSSAGAVVDVAQNTQYGTIYIPNTDIDYLPLYYGDDTAIVSTNAFGQSVSTTQVGYVGPHLLTGYSTAIKEGIYSLNIGDKLHIKTSYGDYVYQIISRDYGNSLVDGTNIVNQNGPLLDLDTELDVLYIYTDASHIEGGAANTKYVVKAVLCL